MSLGFRGSEQEEERFEGPTGEGQVERVFVKPFAQVPVALR